MIEGARLTALALLLVSTVALTMALTAVSTLAQTTGKATETRPRTQASNDIVVTELHIILIKSVLNLQPSQLPHWAPLETALHDLARSQAAAAETDNGEKPRNRVAEGKAVMARIKQIAVAAGPLLKSLDELQRRNLLGLARKAELEHLLIQPDGKATASKRQLAKR